MALATAAARLALLAEAIDTGNYLEGCTLRLFKNDYNPNPNSAEDDFDEADYTGYAAFTPLVWGDPYDLPGGDAQVVAVSHQFQPTATTVGNLIYGWYVTKGTPGTLTIVSAERLDSPENLSGPADALIVNAVFPLPAV